MNDSISGEIAGGSFDDAFRNLYPSAAEAEGLELQRRRYLGLAESLASIHDDVSAPFSPRFISVPGRTELGGNHTDHNLGRVLAASVHLDLAAAVQIRNDRKVKVLSQGYPLIELDLSDLSPREEERESTASLVRGVAAWFFSRGLAVGGFSAAIHSLVPPGSGLSSSAAVEVAIAKSFSILYNDDAIGPVDLAIAGQYAENVHFGKPCGLMDQIACAHGGAVKIDFTPASESDSAGGRIPAVTPVRADFAAAGWFLGIVNSGGSHADLTEDYAAIPREMKSVASALGHSVLGEADPQELYLQLPRLRAEGVVGDRALLRAMHFFAENRRVDAMHSALAKNRYSEYLRLVGESGNSSFRLLQNVVPSGAVVEQNLAVVMSAVQEIFGDRAVIRVHGGGFEGSLQFYVELDSAGELLEILTRLCGEESFDLLYIREQGAVEL